MNKRKTYGRGRPPGDEGQMLEGMMDKPLPVPGGSLDGEDSMLMPMEEDKPRKWQRKGGPGRRKSALQENFPSYMQVCCSALYLGNHMSFFLCPQRVAYSNRTVLPSIQVNLFRQVDFFSIFKDTNDLKLHTTS